MKLLAARDGSSTTAGVTGTSRAAQFAVHLAHAMGARVELVDPGEAGTTTSLQQAAKRSGPGAEAVAVVIAHPDAPGAQTMESTRTLMTSLPAPLVLVPPGEFAVRAVRRVVIALDDDQQPSAALAPLIDALTTAATGVQVIAVHVLDKGSMPVFADQTGHFVEAFRREFCARHLNAAQADVVLRTGDPVVRILDVVRELDADLLALAWHQLLDPGRARVVRAIVDAGEVPVWLAPLTSRDG